ncbi:MAG: hypothetical protein V3T86_01205 [Planctomycetota bacterium]
MLTLALIDIANAPGHRGGPPYIDLPSGLPRWHGEWHSGTADLKLNADGRLFHRGSEIPRDSYATLFATLSRENGAQQASYGRSGWELYKGGAISKLRLMLYVDRNVRFAEVARVIRPACAAGIHVFAFPLKRGRVGMWLRGPRRGGDRVVDVHLEEAEGCARVSVDSVPVDGREVGERISAIAMLLDEDLSMRTRYRIEDSVRIETVLAVLAASGLDTGPYEILEREADGEWVALRSIPQPVGPSAGVPR